MSSECHRRRPPDCFPRWTQRWCGRRTEKRSIESFLTSLLFLYLRHISLSFELRDYRLIFRPYFDCRICFWLHVFLVLLRLHWVHSFNFILITKCQASRVRRKKCWSRSKKNAGHLVSSCDHSRSIFIRSYSWLCSRVLIQIYFWNQTSLL